MKMAPYTRVFGIEIYHLESLAKEGLKFIQMEINLREYSRRTSHATKATTHSKMAQQ